MSGKESSGTNISGSSDELRTAREWIRDLDGDRFDEHKYMVKVQGGNAKEINMGIWSWFQQTKKDALLKFAIGVGKLFLGSLANALWTSIQKEVRLAEETGKTGPEKFELVYKNVTEYYKNQNIATWLVRLLIEACVGYMKEGGLR